MSFQPVLTVEWGCRYGWKLPTGSAGRAAHAEEEPRLYLRNTAIFTIINAVFLHPLPVEEPSRLAEMFTRDTQTIDANTNFQLTGTSLPNYEDYRDQNTAFSGLASVTFPIPLNWGGQAEPQQLNASLVSGNFFDVLGVKPYRGRTFVADGDKKLGGNPEVVLSYSLWVRRFGSDVRLIGRTITLNGTPYTVLGVAPPNFKGIVSLGRPDVLWIPISMRDYVLTGQLKNLENHRRFRWLSIVGRLKPQVGVAEARAAMKTIAAGLEKEYPRDNKGRTVELFPLNESALGINQRRQFSLAGGVLMGVVGLVLLIACGRQTRKRIEHSRGDGRGALPPGPAAFDRKHRAFAARRIGRAAGSLRGTQNLVVLPASVSSRRFDRSLVRCPRAGIYSCHLSSDRLGIRHHPGHQGLPHGHQRDFESRRPWRSAGLDPQSSARPAGDCGNCAGAGRACRIGALPSQHAERAAIQSGLRVAEPVSNVF